MSSYPSQTLSVDSSSAQSSITEILKQIENPDNPRRGEKRFLDFELENINKNKNKNDNNNNDGHINNINESSERFSFFKRESFGCCRKIMRVMLYDLIIGLILFINGICGIITTLQIRSEIVKYFDNTTCDSYIITNTLEHANTVTFVSLSMVIYSLLIIIILVIFWKWTWNKLIEASHKPTKYLQYRTTIKKHSKIIFSINLIIFLCLNLVLFWSGTRFWRDVEDADNEICIVDQTLDNLSDQLKYVLMPSFIIACLAVSCIIFAWFTCVYCPYGIECCCCLIGVKDENKYREWREQNKKKNSDGNSCSCSLGTCSGTCSGGSCS